MSLNGPYFYGSDGRKKFDFSWTKFSNMLFVDNPIGVGFSQSASEEGLDNSMEMVSRDFNAFLSKFFEGEGSKYKDYEFYISGGSYAGKYISQIAHDYFFSN